MYSIEEIRQDFERLTWELYEYFNETLDDDMPDKCDELKARIDEFCESLKAVL